MKRVSRRHALRVSAAMLLLAVLLGGCIEVRIESTFEDDLSALHALQTTIERAGLDQLAAMGGEDTDPFEDSAETRAQAEAAGLTYEEIDTDEHVGWRVSKRYEDSSDLGAVLNEMSADADPEVESADTFSGSIVRDGNTYRLNLTVNSSDIFEDQESEADDLGMDPSALFSFVYIMTMPGTVTETNGTRVGDNQIRWELPITGTTTLTAVSEVSSPAVAGGTSSVIIIAVVAALVLAAGAAVYFLSQRRRQSATLGAAPAPGIAPMAGGAGLATAGPIVTGTGEKMPPADPDPEPGPDDDTTRLPRP
jgi:hypothetical protein